MPKANCPCCGKSQLKHLYQDYHGLSYSKCLSCESHVQDPRVFVKYEDCDWTSTTDPDGIVRNLTTERDAKIKNWYGAITGTLNKHKAPSKVLDFGAGLGYLLSSLNKNWDKTALEKSTFATAFIKSHYPEIKVINSDLTASLFEPNSFDVVILYHVIEHLENPHELLENISLILKKGGKLIIGTPNSKSIACRLFRHNFRLYGSGHYCIYHPAALKKLIESKGFKSQSIEYPYFETDYFNLTNVLKLMRLWEVSPPFWGSIFTIYATNEKAV